MAARKRLVVLHLAGRYPLGGIGWQAAQYVLGLTRLGRERGQSQGKQRHRQEAPAQPSVEVRARSVPLP